ncbi:MAG: DUF2125 domain-containing protein [Alphaproteobacteria bacterium]
MPLNKSPSLRPLGVMFLALFLPSSVYAAYWVYAGSKVRTQIEKWSQARREEGYQVGYDRIDIKGFPLHLDIRIEKPVFRFPEARGGWSWQTAALDARLSPLNPRAATISANSPQTFHPPANIETGITTLTATTATAGLVFQDNGSPATVHVEFGSVRLAGLASGGEVRARHLKADADWFSPDSPDPANRTMILAAEGRDMDLPPSLGLPLGPRIEAFALQAEVHGRIAGEDITQALSDWRQAGGTVDVPNLLVHWPPVRMHTNGTLALDDQLQPIGAFTAGFQGFFEAVGSFVKQGIIRPRDASMAKVVLGMLAKTPSGGGVSTVSMPMTLQNRTLYAGPVALIHLPDVRWSESHHPKPLPQSAGAGATDETPR